MASLTLMEDELYRAAVRGDVRALSEANIANHGDSYFVDQTAPENNNIIHIAAEHGQAEFIKEALARFPILARRKNGNMDTPLHVASRMGYEEVVRLLTSYEGCATKEEGQAKEAWPWPWMAKNLQGDTPLHLALCSNKLKVAMDLLDVGSTVALSLVNSCQETPLHIFLKYCIGTNTTDNALLEGVLNLQGVYKSKESSSSSKMMRSDVLKELLKYKPAICIRDERGLTPLLIAAEQGSFLALRLILDECPQSSKVCDPEGGTVLHHLKTFLSPGNYSYEFPCNKTRYEELKELLNVLEIDAIKDAKDSRGKTPAYIALEKGDFVLVQVLVECFADFTIKNKDGVSALDLIKSCPDFAAQMGEVIAPEKVFSQLMDEKLFQEAKEGKLTLLERCEIDVESGKVTYPDGDDYFLRQTRQGLSILHLAVKHGHQEFLKKAMEHFPTLILAADSSGENPLHVGARLSKDHHPVADALLQLTEDWVNKFRAETGASFLGGPPWRQKNSKGDSPLHEALRSSNYGMAESLIGMDSELLSFENGAGETPLHILARHGTYSKFDKIGALVKQLIGHNGSVVNKCDSNGFTPLLRAAYCGRIRVAYWIIRHCPASVQFRDSKGRTFLHLLRLEPTAELDFMTTEDMLYVYTNILVLTSETEFDGSRAPNMIPVSKYENFRKLTGAEFDGLRSSQDVEGNTPLHFALKNKKFAAAKFLLLWCVESKLRQEMTVINNEGHSVLNLLELLGDDTPCNVRELKDLASLAQKKIKEEAFGVKMMDTEVYQAAVEGDVGYFFKEKKENQGTDDDATGIITNDEGNNGPTEFGSQVAPDGSNILHIALQHRQYELAERVTQHFPDLIWKRNSNGDTPIHTAAKTSVIGFGGIGLWRVVDVHGLQWEEICQKYDDSPSLSEEGLLIIPPWRVKNSQGNTPLHEACRREWFSVEGMLSYDSEVSAYVNHAGETPLHMSAKRNSVFRSDWEGLLGTKSVGYVCDREGLTPLLRAAKFGNIVSAKRILAKCPESIQLRDDKGKSFLHLLRVTEEHMEDDLVKKRVKDLYETSTVDALHRTADFDGNTPLHAAIQDGNSIAAKLLAKTCGEADDPFSILEQRCARNNEGKSTLDLLASHDDAPTEALQHLIDKVANIKKRWLYQTSGWVRSRNGATKSQIKDVANTLSVVAGLFVTITFAAAFQVPGGFKGDSGNPVLLRKVAFKVFMICNSFAMCGSMTVLFCLLWVMLTGSATKSFLLLDLCVFILQLSFAATLMSFMTGVYVAVFQEALWLGIFICALCSTVIFLMRKWFILPITRFFRLSLFGIAWCKKYVSVLMLYICKYMSVLSLYICKYMSVLSLYICKVLPIYILTKILPRDWSIRILGVDPEDP